MLSAIISLLTGCGKSQSATAPSPPPKAPGVSVALKYPVLLIGERDLRIKDDQDSLITTTVASGGLYYASYVFIDSDGNQFSLKSATAFNQTPAWRDMGTSPYQAFIELAPQGKIDLQKARDLALEALFKPGDLDEKTKAIAGSRVNAASSFQELIQVLKDPLADDGN